ncbi:alpha/beta hydrolase [Aspergillus undulatus]|uniref:alpha/beta hydrolase n=1 Tax=Aspergillus undulatus TaxID=1810928 RepID=UPI003CCD8E51
MANVQTSTHTFKVVNKLSLSIDVTKPAKTSEKGIALLHFHGGYLVLGEKTTGPPHWLINACRRRGWTYATPSYRLLPESAGLDILSDALDAVKWVVKNISDRIIIAGSSAGGYLALAAAAHPDCPRPLAVLSNYGMLDPSSRRYVEPGHVLRGPTKDLRGTVKEIKQAMENGKVIDGYPFPVNPPTDHRFGWIKALHEAALFPDVLTRIPGLASRIVAEGVEAIQPEYRSLFPVQFGLKRSLPPVVLLHGDTDELVGIDQSVRAAEKMTQLGIDVHLERAVGQGHGFEHKSVIDLDAGNAEEDEKMLECLRRVVAVLEKHVAKSA